MGESVRRGFVETPSSWFWERFEPSGFIGERCMHSTLFGLRACACTADWHAYCCMHAWHAFNVASLNNVAVIINSMLIVMETMRRVFIVPPQRKRARMRRDPGKKKCKRIWFPNHWTRLSRQQRKWNCAAYKNGTDWSFDVRLVPPSIL